MSKKVKALIQDELKNRYEGVNEFLVISLRGINGNENNELRGDLRDKKIKVNVVKNSLAQRALGDNGIDDLSNLFQGPCAIATGGDSIVDAAKIMVDWSKKLEKLEIKGSFVEGNVYDQAQTVELSKLPNRKELQSQVVGLALTPGSNLAGAIKGPAGYLAGCIKTIIENLEGSEAA